MIVCMVGNLDGFFNPTDDTVPLNVFDCIRAFVLQLCLLQLGTEWINSCELGRLE